MCLVFATSALASTHKVPEDEPIATIQIPNHWQTKEVGESVTAASPDGTVSFLVTRGEGTKIAESIGEVMRYLRNRDSITVEADSIKKTSGKLKDMEITNMSWKGKDKKGAVEISFTIVWIAENKALIVAHWGSPEAEKKHGTEVNKMLQSIKKT
jgi:hypothetical protein